MSSQEYRDADSHEPQPSLEGPAPLNEMPRADREEVVRQQLRGTRRGDGQEATAAAAPANGEPEEAEQPEVTVDELASRVTIHDDKPMENLPPISPPELKIIGRCVTFTAETTIGSEVVVMHYEGLIATINKDTVMLIYVHRYTEEDFQSHFLEQKEMRTESGLGGDGKKSGEGSHTAEAAKKTDSSMLPAGTSEGLLLGREEEQGQQQSTYPTTNLTGETHGEVTQRVRNRMQSSNGSMGPIPFVTFSRHRIHNVQFARDPPSRFFSLFEDPSKTFFDMQCLRMFVRRYIVHTAQGNNPRNVPLRTFVTTRCHCPDLENELLYRVTHEEVRHLIKVDRDMKRAHKKKERGRRNLIRTYRAPAGLFSETGVLYLTRIPKQTFSVAIVEAALILVVAVYMAVIFTTSNRLVETYMHRYTPYLATLCGCGILGALASVRHSLVMCLPLEQHMHTTVLRAFFLVATVASSIMTLVIMSRGLTVVQVSRFVESLPQNTLCTYYKEAECTGFSTSCFQMESTSPEYQFMCAGCGLLPPSLGNSTCKGSILGEVGRPIIPILCFTAVVLVLFIIDCYMLYKLFYIVRLLMQRM